MILNILFLASASVLWSGVSGPPVPGGSVRPGAQVAYGLEARIWLEEGDEPVLRPGAREGVYYRVSEDAYVAVFQIDTNGRVRLLFPRAPYEDPFVRSGPSYRLFVHESPYWYVDHESGMGYFFIVASPRPLDFSAFRYSEYEDEWDLGLVRARVYGDPYVAMEEFVAYLVPDGRYVDYALDFAVYHVGQAYVYPRFLCYDCHGFRPFGLWDPYAHTCLRFRVVVYDDPYYYPWYRYRGTRVVYGRPPAARQPRFVFKERAQGEAGTPLVRSRPDVDVLAARSLRRGTGEVVGAPSAVAPVPAPAPAVDAPGRPGGAWEPELEPTTRTRRGGSVAQPVPERAERADVGRLISGLRVRARGPEERVRPGGEAGPPAVEASSGWETERPGAREVSDFTGAIPRVEPEAHPREEPPQERPKLERRPPSETRPVPQPPAVKPMVPGGERREPQARPFTPPPGRESKPSDPRTSRPPPVRESKPPPVRDSRPPSVMIPGPMRGGSNAVQFAVRGVPRRPMAW